ncbi:MAG: hypothetical protein ABFD12_09325 [Syntrophorhabdus sp.]
MEKTQGLVMDDKEKKSLARKELANNLKALYRRFREGLIDEREAKSQLDSGECDAEFKRKLVLDLLTEEFDLCDDISALNTLLTFVRFVVDEHSYQELRAIEKDCNAELKKLKAGLQSKIVEDLKTLGVTGSSVEPNVEMWPRWQETTADVRRAFKKQIEEWKARVL